MHLSLLAFIIETSIRKLANLLSPPSIAHYLSTHISLQQIYYKLNFACLHWFPIKSHTRFIILLITYKTLKCPYLSDSITLSKPKRPLRSATSSLIFLCLKNITLLIDNRVFSIIVPKLWNELLLISA